MERSAQGRNRKEAQTGMWTLWRPGGDDGYLRGWRSERASVDDGRDEGDAENDANRNCERRRQPGSTCPIGSAILGWGEEFSIPQKKVQLYCARMSLAHPPPTSCHHGPNSRTRLTSLWPWFLHEAQTTQPIHTAAASFRPPSTLSRASCSPLPRPPPPLSAGSCTHPRAALLLPPLAVDVCLCGPPACAPAPFLSLPPPCHRSSPPRASPHPPPPCPPSPMVRR